MYAYFTQTSQTNFKTKNNLPHFLDRLTELSYEAKSLYAMLVGYIDVNRSHEQHKTGKIVKQHGLYKVTDGDNVYVESARSTIAGIMGKAMGTVRKYIKELRLHGLLVDVRMGQGRMNRLFLKYPVDAEYTYENKKKPKREEMCEYLETKNRQEKSDEEVAASSSPKPSSDDTLIQVRSIISQIADDCLSKRDCKNLLNLAKGDTIDDKLDDIQRAVVNCYGKTPKTTHYRMICNTLEKRYHEDKPKKQNINKPNKQSNKLKSGFKADIYSHNWDLDELENLASTHWQE